MILFLLDACAVARHYFPDVGTANVDQIFAYPDGTPVIPNLARAETVSAMIAAFNGGVIEKDVLDLALTTFLDDVQKRKIVEIEVHDRHISDSIHLLQKHKFLPRGQIGTGKAGRGRRGVPGRGPGDGPAGQADRRAGHPGHFRPGAVSGGGGRAATGSLPFLDVPV